jgi:NAD(P)-dependent dehydrogenase (short-subunit alcohol dehydrogenase family)
MDLGLSGKVVLITGGSKGIGYACAEAFAAEGAHVAVVSRSEANLAAAAAKLAARGHNAFCMSADLSRRDAGERIVAEVERALGAVDVLVNSAGAAKRYAPEELDVAAWHDAMDAKYFSYVHAMQAVLPGMLARGRGVIINIIGGGGKVAAPVHLPGGAANAALMLVSTGLANAYGRKGIRVNAINPGLTLTGRVEEGVAAESRRSGVAPAELLAKGAERIPLGRYAEPKEIASVAVFLASSRASYVTGAIVPMDGGTNPVI